MASITQKTYEICQHEQPDDQWQDESQESPAIVHVGNDAYPEGDHDPEDQPEPMCNGFLHYDPPPADRKRASGAANEKPSSFRAKEVTRGHGAMVVRRYVLLATA
jgi:hypothetical protein